MTIERAGDVAAAPGVATFLFTDIEGSTQLIERHADAMGDALARHHALVSAAIVAHRGRVFNVVGDAFCAVFDDGADALAAALDTQRALFAESWGAIGSVRVRIGLHTGVADLRDGEFAPSLALVRAQRVMAAGHGGQVLLSAAAADALRARLPPATTLRDLGPYKLRGLAEPESIHQAVASDLPSEFPHLRVEESAPAVASPLGRLVSGQLVGRSAELAQLERYFDDAQQARGHLVLLSGEPGVGKTRLAQAVIAHAQRNGATVLRGGCYEYEATTPYLPFVEALRQWVHGKSVSELRALLGPTAPEIAKFAPEIESRLGALAPNPPLPPNEERLRLFDNVARFVEAIAADRGLLVFIDDVHWADQGTLSLLHYLLRHLRERRVLFVAAYREVELDRTHPLASALVDWNRERLATRVPLGRLSLEATGTLLAALFGQESVSEDFARALYAETEGNPFFVEEVVKSLIEQGTIYREGERWQRKETHELAIPQSVKEAIGRRLNRLSEAAVDALRTAAALGKVFAFRELAGVAAGGEDALLDALDAATAAQLIQVNPGADDAFAFTHDKIREVLYEELNPIRRRRLHQRIGEALEKLYAVTPDSDDVERAQELAYHFTQSGDLARSLAYSRRAARNAVRVFAHDEALKFLEQAREAAEALRRAGDVAAVDEAIGDILVARGVVRGAVESYERALAASTSAEARASLKVKVGNAYVPIGDPRGLTYLEQARIELDPGTQPNALALATALVGRYYHYRSEEAKAIEFLERARVLAEPLDDAAVLADVYTYLAGAYQHRTQYDESNRWAQMCIALGERKRFPLAIAMGHEFLAENAAGRGLWDDAMAHAAKDAEQGLKLGALARVAWASFARMQGLHAQGRLAEARAESLEAHRLCDQIGEARLAAWLEPAAAMIAADLGDDDTARAYAENGLQRSRDLDQLVLLAWAFYGLGYTATRRGDAAAIVDAYDQLTAAVRGSENRVACLFTLGEAADAFAEAGRLDEASALADETLVLARFARAPHRYAIALRARARVLAATGHADEAAAALDEAIATFERCGSRLERARTLLRRAALRLAGGDRDLGRADAGSACEEFDAMGAVHDRAEAERVLRD